MPIGNLIACMFISNEKEMNNKHSALEAAVENNNTSGVKQITKIISDMTSGYLDNNNETSTFTYVFMK